MAKGMEVDAALLIADTLIFNQTGNHLNTLQTSIFRGAWSGQKYEEIAQANYCSDSHVKMVGSNLWELLSEALEEKVTKKNFRAVLQRRNITPQNLEIVDKPSKPGLSRTIELELPEGQVPLNSRFYVQRPPIESQCARAIVKPGALIRIKAPKQMGKSSLMIRIIQHAIQQNYHTVTIDFQLADRQIFQDFDLFLKWFCVSISRGLGLPNRVAEYWDDIFGSKMSCKDYLENYLLAQIEQPLILALEEVDSLFQYPNLADDFFALLRSWHEEAKSRRIWQKLRLILVHSTEVYLPLNINQSPFNVGLPIELPEFTPTQILNLARIHGLDWNLNLVQELTNTIGGHPFLVRVALYYLVQQQQTLGQLFSSALTETSPFSNHLRRHLWQLQQQPQLAEGLRMALETSSPVRLGFIEMFKLHSMGLVNLQGNEITLRCQLYRQYFSDRLKELRSQ